MEPTHIEVRGARVHNLRGVSLRLPRNALICMTGVSGSGKSSLAFDTLYAEGQRRYIESLSSYARQFLGQIEKPDCDLITGLSPSIAIQQKTAGQNPRSTVGTITAIHDFLRVLYARVGLQHCTKCGRPISAQTREQIIGGILAGFGGGLALLLAPIARGQKGEFRDAFADLVRAGFLRARVDGRLVDLREPVALEKNRKHDIEVVIDRLTVDDAQRARLAEAVENGLRIGKGTLVVARAEGSGARRAANSSVTGAAEQVFSSDYACTRCNLSFEPPTPQLFSFNSPTGMCPQCDGLGETVDFDPDLLVPDDSANFLTPCIAPMRTTPGRWRRHIYEGVARHLGIKLTTPWRDLPKSARDALLFGTGDAHITYEWRWSGGAWKHGGTFEGVVAELRDKYRKARAGFVRQYYEKYMRRGVCPECRGARLNEQARAVRIAVREDVLADEEKARRHEGTKARRWEEENREQHRATKGESRKETLKENVETSKRRNVETSKTGGGTVSERRAGREDQGSQIETRWVALHELCAMSIEDALRAIDALVLTPVQRQIAAEVLKELRARLGFLLNVGLHYLTLDRAAPTLSGGEAQRIRLAGQIGSGLAGVLYVLDEPSIGLHPRDNLRLLASLKALRDLGNTVIVVEHDEETMREADWLVDFGPGPGIHGGNIVAQGSYDEVTAVDESLTAQYLRHERLIDVPKQRRPVTPPQAPASKRDATARKVKRRT